MYINTQFDKLGVYTSKDLSHRAKTMPDVIVLSFGEPDFGPPSYLADRIQSEALNYQHFLDGTSRYENPRGALSLRKKVSDWYQKNYDISVDPEREIMITHGGVEAINLAILCSANEGDNIMVSQPSYMLYQNTIDILSRKPISLTRGLTEHQYKDIFDYPGKLSDEQRSARSLIVNSPENPSGYVMSEEDWRSVSDYSLETGLCVIHDEVYDTMAFDRSHKPAWYYPELRDRSILINSFSKKFGIPGLRIGWLVAPASFIDLAAKLHDYMYLGVNIQYEKIAETIVGDNKINDWLSQNSDKIAARRDLAVSKLTEDRGFVWNRSPHGAMFLFPEISGVYERLSDKYKSLKVTKGEAVARYFLEEKRVSVVPGYVYGDRCANHIRMVLCVQDREFQDAIDRICEE